MAPSRDYYAEQLDPDNAETLIQTLKDLHEPPLWTVHRDQNSGHGVYRLTVLSSFHSAVCAIVQVRDSGDATLRIKLCEMVSKKSRHTSSGGYLPPPQDLVFDESRLLQSDEFLDTISLFSSLQEGTPLKLPPDLPVFFAQMDGTLYFFEAYEEDDHYRVIPIYDPSPLNENVRELLLKCFPKTDINDVEYYVNAYMDVLQWFAKATNLQALQGYRKLPNKETQAIVPPSPLPNH